MWLGVGAGTVAVLCMATTKTTRTILTTSVRIGAGTALAGCIGVVGLGVLSCASLYVHNLLASEDRKNKMVASYMPGMMVFNKSGCVVSLLEYLDCGRRIA